MLKDFFQKRRTKSIGGRDLKRTWGIILEMVSFFLAATNE